MCNKMISSVESLSAEYWTIGFFNDAKSLQGVTEGFPRPAKIKSLLLPSRARVHPLQRQASALLPAMPTPVIPIRMTTRSTPGEGVVETWMQLMSMSRALTLAAIVRSI